MIWLILQFVGCSKMSNNDNHFPRLSKSFIKYQKEHKSQSKVAIINGLTLSGLEQLFNMQHFDRRCNRSLFLSKYSAFLILGFISSNPKTNLLPSLFQFLSLCLSLSVTPLSPSFLLFSSPLPSLPPFLSKEFFESLQQAKSHAKP